MKTTTFLKLLLMTLVMSMSMIFASSTDANASHFRYGSITWKRDMPNNPNRIIFTVTQAYRKTFYTSGQLLPGAQISTDYFYSGYTTGSRSIVLTVTSVNNVEDWFEGKAEFYVDYPATATNYVAYFSGCCKISTLENNRDGNYYVSTTVTAGQNNDAPVIALPPYLNMPRGLVAGQYQLYATDPNGDAITYSLSPNNSFGASSVQPTGVSVSPSGLLTVNTTNRAVGALVNTNITIQDSKGAKIMVDVIVKVTETSTPPVFDYVITPANSFVYKVAPNTSVSFPLAATDADSGNVVNISASGIPIGANFSSSIGNPANASFSWTPTMSNLGTYALNFTATDNLGVPANTIVYVVVSAAPSFVTPTPGNNSVLCAVPGTPFQFDLVATDPDPTDTVTLDVVSGAQVGMTYTNALPLTNQASASTSFSWVPADSQWGIHHFITSAKDKYGDSVTNTIHLIVNNPPTITSSPITAVNVNALYQYTLTTADVDAIYGDSVRMEVANLPSFLTAIDNGDGTVTISGTPTIADTGIHNVLIEMQDKTNHFRGTHCGHVTQIFSVEVKPCDLTTNINIDSAHNIPNHPNNTIYLGYGRQDVVLSANSNGAQPITYLWSSGDSTMVVTMEPDTTTTYTVYITDAYGCKDSADYTIYVEDIDCTPSKDKGKNDCKNHGKHSDKHKDKHSNKHEHNGKGHKNKQDNCKHKGDNHGRHHGNKCNKHENSKKEDCDKGCRHSSEYRISKVTMCHKSGKRYQEICVDIRSVAAHLAHGDRLGSCGSGTEVAIIEALPTMNLYPNPTSDMISIELGVAPVKGEVKIIDALGRVVLQQSIAEIVTSLNISQLASGVYIVDYSDGDLNLKSKLVKK